jgi:hypothetical protein
MTRRLLLLVLLLPAACHRQPVPTQPANGAQPRATRTEAQAGPAVQPAEEKADAAGAADVLRRYYALIEAGRYGDAWAMRTAGRGIDEAQFAAHFKAYEGYRSQIGTPSAPVAQQGWTYVEVPVMTTGRFLGGKPFGSSGSVTLRRPAPGSDAPPAARGWRIYTG